MRQHERKTAEMGCSKPQRAAMGKMSYHELQKAKINRNEPQQIP